MTSENKDRLTADGSSANWVIIEGASKTKEGRSGILFMGFPANKEFPESMRVWPINANDGRGDMFFEFCPIRYKEWKIGHEEHFREVTKNHLKYLREANIPDWELPNMLVKYYTTSQASKVVKD